jgi:glycosyltransferase involved in cell wall biosynthesis
MYLDFTMAQAIKEWKPWASFKKEQHQAQWLEYERRSYQNAETLFTMGKATAAALVNDYGINPGKVVIVGSGGNFDKPFAGKRNFGSKLIIFQGSDFERKGGEIVIAAFPIIRSYLPETRLVAIGTERKIPVDGVEVLGLIEQHKVRRLLQQADLVLAPAFCDPFTAFVIEAMNYGTPCVVTRASGISDTIGDGGIVIDQPDPTLLAQAAISLLSSPSNQLRASEAARKIVKDTLNWQAVAERIAAGIMAENGNQEITTPH